MLVILSTFLLSAFAVIPEEARASRILRYNNKNGNNKSKMQ